MIAHRYVRRADGAVVDERLFADRVVRFLYSRARERTPALFRALTGPRASDLIATLHFDLPLGARLLGNRRFLRRCGVRLSECLDPPESLDTPRKIFERRIRYWDCRPMPEEPDAVVSPADARVLVGSLARTSRLFIKEKFFLKDELLGDRPGWAAAFEGGDFAVFRLTPDKYHWNHAPVAGVVRDVYEVAGHTHACNPSAVVEVVTPYSKNRRTVTVIDTDVPGGTGVGLVAMVEVTALMIGRVEQRYSDVRYDSPRPVRPGLFVRRGAPKSLYHPGSSTDVLLFERGRIAFAPDLIANQGAEGVSSRFSERFGIPLVETDVALRSLLARPAARD